MKKDEIGISAKKNDRLTITPLFQQFNCGLAKKYRTQEMTIACGRTHYGRMLQRMSQTLPPVSGIPVAAKTNKHL